MAEVAVSDTAGWRRTAGGHYRPASPPRSMAPLASLHLLLCLGWSIASPAPPYDVIVVGLGAAGATAATTLARAGRRVLALEAQPRVGGRVFTTPFGDGLVETGAEWIHGAEHSRVYEAAVQHGVRVRDDAAGVQVVRSGGARSPALAALLDYCLEVMEEGSDVNETMGQLIERKVREHLITKDPELLADEEALKSFLEMAELAVGSFEATDDWNRVSALKGYESLGGSQTHSWHRYGYKTFFEILMNTYNGGEGLPSLEVQLNKEVTNIRWSADDVTVRCADGAQYSAPHAVVTVSLGVLKERHSTLFSPPLPQEKVAAIDLIDFGLMNKIILAFEEPWPLADINMFYWEPADKKQLPAADSWTSKLLGVSKPLGSNNTLTAWAVGDNAKFIETLPLEEVKTKVVAWLRRFLRHVTAVPPPVAIIRTTWHSNPFTRGSYSFDSPAVARGGLRGALAAPLPAAGTPRLLFAGEATDTTHFSTVHGASDTGHREAQRLLALTGTH